MSSGTPTPWPTPNAADPTPTVPPNYSGYYYLYGDHLQSASLLTLDSGVAQQRTYYRPYGSHRPDWGENPTDRDFTNQRLDAAAALLDYGARRAWDGERDLLARGSCAIIRVSGQLAPSHPAQEERHHA